jgi:hypothetical protein
MIDLDHRPPFWIERDDALGFRWLIASEEFGAEMVECSRGNTYAELRLGFTQRLMTTAGVETGGEGRQPGEDLEKCSQGNTVENCLWKHIRASAGLSS